MSFLFVCLHLKLSMFICRRRCSGATRLLVLTVNHVPGFGNDQNKVARVPYLVKKAVRIGNSG
jgi:hypothetical protein